MAFTPDGIAPPGIPLLGCSPPTSMRYRTVYWGELQDSMTQIAETRKFGLSFRPFLWRFSRPLSCTQKRSRHSKDTVREFHAEVPRAAACRLRTHSKNYYVRA